MSRYQLAVRALRLKLAGASADPTEDYNAASTTYDEYFTRVMGGHSVALLDDVPLSPGDHVIELACGTGHLTAELARRLNGTGRLQVVDKSPAMLAVARQKVTPSPRLSVGFTEGDMDEFLQGQPAASADVIVIGWAICYSQPTRLLREVHRVLRPNGHVAVIETKGDALATLRKAMEQVVIHDPSVLTSLIRVTLPRSERTLGRWFARSGLQAVTLRSGTQPLPCRTAEDALEWIERSGAGAGFRDTFDSTCEQEVWNRLRVELDRIRDRRGDLGLTHTYVAGVATRQVVVNARAS